MNPFLYFYTEFLWRPLFNALVWLYVVLPWQDLGVAIIALTFVMRIILFPLLWKGQKSQKEFARLQPEIKKIQETHKHDREAQTKALMDFYATEKMNPFMGCLAMLLQIPVLIALFQVFRSGFDPKSLTYLYTFISNPGSLNPISFGFLDLSQGNIYLGVIAAATQYIQTKLTIPPPQKTAAGAGDFSRIMSWQTQYIFPALVLAWSYSLPSALTLYWTVMNIFAILQEFIMRAFAKKKAEER